jgi:hypothetical protein
VFTADVERDRGQRRFAGSGHQTPR